MKPSEPELPRTPFPIFLRNPEAFIPVMISCYMFSKRKCGHG
ncbi:hypothetical protein HMPREF9440_00408 [Sutterella parvirubra YIT 11816]|uniref:Uncharacterized protein n=1 Tax=Sutterella parvirubra YIT 11816 TaxID=762967 RepID=H3KCF6_9BURK|nr:hypothetical protein HMPREF9440_00408 [Sutterella parvirubra YIT 11816]